MSGRAGTTVKAMGLGAADFQHLREKLVKLRANLTDVP
jgi:hypothetical protein